MHTAGEYTLQPKLLKDRVFIKCLGNEKETMTNNIDLLAEQWNKPKHGLLGSSMYIFKGGTDQTLKNNHTDANIP